MSETVLNLGVQSAACLVRGVLILHLARPGGCNQEFQDHQHRGHARKRQVGGAELAASAHVPNVHARKAWMAAKHISLSPPPPGSGRQYASKTGLASWICFFRSLAVAREI